MKLQLNLGRNHSLLPVTVPGLLGVICLVASAWIWIALDDPVVWGILTLVLGIALIAYYILGNREQLKRAFTRRRMYTGANALIFTAAVIGIVVLVNVIAGRHHTRWDLTRNANFTLSSQTISVLEDLEDDVNITVFSRPGGYEGQTIRDLLTEYELRSKRISVEYVDPDKEPALAKEYEIMSYNTVVVEVGDRKQSILPYEMFEQDPYYQTAPKFKGEQAVTQALVDLTTTEEKGIYFLTGHDERDLFMEYSTLVRFIRGESYSAKSTNIASEGGIARDADLLVIAGPKRDLTPEEIAEVEEFLITGGNVIVAVDPSEEKQTLPNLRAMLSRWGIGINDDVVVDPARQYFIDPLSPIPKYEYHEITSELMTKDLGIVLPRSRSLYKMVDASGELEITPLLVTSDEAWGETTLTGRRLQKDSNDNAGPLTLAFLAEKSVEKAAFDDTDTAAEGSDASQAADEDEGTTDTDGSGGKETQEQPGKLLVIGSSSFLTDDVLSFQGNVDFFMNAVNWMLDKGDRLYIRAKTPEFEQIYLSGAQMASIRYGTMLVMPLAFILAGATIWMRRRNL